MTQIRPLIWPRASVASEGSLLIGQAMCTRNEMGSEKFQTASVRYFFTLSRRGARNMSGVSLRPKLSGLRWKIRKKIFWTCLGGVAGSFPRKCRKTSKIRLEKWLYFFYLDSYKKSDQIDFDPCHEDAVATIETKIASKLKEEIAFPWIFFARFWRFFSFWPWNDYFMCSIHD